MTEALKSWGPVGAVLTPMPVAPVRASAAATTKQIEKSPLGRKDRHIRLTAFNDPPELVPFDRTSDEAKQALNPIC